MGPMTIREVIKADREALSAIIMETENLSGEERDCAHELIDIYLSDPLQKDYFFITAIDAGSPAGYACYGKRPLTDAVYDLYWILVDAGKRNRGIGNMLLRRAEEDSKKKGARMMVAETSGLPAYKPARCLYEKNGYTEEARVRGFYKPGDDLVVYVKRLRPERN